MSELTYYQKNKERIKAKAKARYESKKLDCIQQAKHWKQKNPERFKISQAKWLEKNPNYSMYHNAKRRAKKLGIPFDISFKDIVMPSHCPVLDIEFLSSNTRENSPSLDRIRPELGYTKGNICVISMRANRIKGDGSPEEHRKIADYIDFMIKQT